MRHSLTSKDIQAQNLNKLDDDLKQAGGKGFFSKRPPSSGPCLDKKDNQVAQNHHFKFSRRKSREGIVLELRSGAAGSLSSNDGVGSGKSKEKEKKKSTPRFNPHPTTTTTNNKSKIQITDKPEK